MAYYQVDLTILCLIYIINNCQQLVFTFFIYTRVFYQINYKVRYDNYLYADISKKYLLLFDSYKTTIRQSHVYF